MKFIFIHQRAIFTLIFTSAYRQYSSCTVLSQIFSEYVLAYNPDATDHRQGKWEQFTPAQRKRVVTSTLTYFNFAVRGCRGHVLSEYHAALPDTR